MGVRVAAAELAMIIDGTYVTDADRIRLMREIEEQANVEANTTVVAESLQRAPIASASETGQSEQLASDEIRGEGQQIKRIHYQSNKPRNGHFL